MSWARHSPSPPGGLPGYLKLDLLEAAFAFVLDTTSGIGKNDDSAKLIPPRCHGACRCRDQSIARR